MSSSGARTVRIDTAVVLLLCAACSTTPRTDYSGLELIDVGGRVTLDGVVLRGARVEFESADGTCSSAITDERGRYRLMFNSEQAGCQPGEKIVRIRMAPAGGNVEDPDAADTSPVAIPACYNSDSQLRASVSAARQSFDFDLSTAPPVMGEAASPEIATSQ